VRVVAALSGGVDSSVTCALLAREGHEVIGVTLKLWTPQAAAEGGKSGGCCSPRDIGHAREVCRQLGLPHYTLNTEEKFRRDVVDDFVSEYVSGRTPNPCVRCNAFIKFDFLLKYAAAMDADALATGHYARITHSGDRFELRRAADPSKDQSYFLYMLGPSQLPRLLFPVGGLEKTQVRGIAESLGLATAGKRDSQDVCFLEGRDYRDFVEERLPAGGVGAAARGPIMTADGKVVGRHDGLFRYTVGQREKLGVSLGSRHYVVKKDMPANALVLGRRDENTADSCRVGSVNWCAGSPPAENFRASVRLRYRHAGAAAEVTARDGGRAEVRFDSGQAPVTAGQSAVFYDGDVVLGGGIVDEA